MSTHAVFPKCGVLLLNSGGPENLSQVESFLFRLLADPRMLQLPAGRWYQNFLARRLARWRTPETKLRYRMIGGASPVALETRALADGLSARLSLPVTWAMRYSEPGVPAGLAFLAAARVQRLVAVSLYPQYSFTTTGSAFDELARFLPRSAGWARIDSYHVLPGFIQATAKLLTDRLKECGPGKPKHVLFTAHSLPRRYLRGGDPYVDQVRATVATLQGKLPPGISSSLAFQSRIGPWAWQGPSLEEALRNLIRKGVQGLLVCPITFVTENLETCFDLDIRFQQQCLQAGVKGFIRLPTVGHSEIFRAALAERIQEAIRVLPRQGSATGEKRDCHA